MFFPHFDVIYDLSLNRRTAKCNQFVNYILSLLEYEQSVPIFTYSLSRVGRKNKGMRKLEAGRGLAKFKSVLFIF